MKTPTDDLSHGTTQRQAAMRLCALANASELAQAVDAVAPNECVADLRPPERGLVMVRGRIGGEGGAFNVGEVTVARAAVRLGDGATGFAYHLGRDMAKARHAAILDALAQRQGMREAIDAVLAPIAERLANEERAEAERIAATRVEFFTMTRGED